MIFFNFKKQQVILEDSSYQHIVEIHPEVTLEQIKATLEDPDEVRKSSHHFASELYYLLKSKKRFICVVVKICPDGNFVSTAMTTTMPKEGRVIYRKGE